MTPILPKCHKYQNVKPVPKALTVIAGEFGLLQRLEHDGVWGIKLLGLTQTLEIVTLLGSFTGRFDAPDLNGAKKPPQVERSKYGVGHHFQ